MTRINEELGRSMSAQEVAANLNIDVKTARKYYRELGGIRIGRIYMFFEEEVCNAIRKNRVEGQQGNKGLDRAGKDGQQEEGKTIQAEERSRGLGSEDERSIKRRLEQKDRHGIFG